MYQKITRNIKSDLCKVNDIVFDMISEIKGSIEDEHLFNIRLILSELIINSIEHGNKNNIEKNIDVVLVVDDEFIRICVTDEGEGINYEKKENDLCDYSECGRGLMIVQGLSDRVVIDENTINCVKYIR